MNKMVFCAAAAVAVAAITAGCRSGSSCCDKKGCTKMTNEEFYDGGTFDTNGIKLINKIIGMLVILGSVIILLTTLTNLQFVK